MSATEKGTLTNVNKPVAKHDSQRGTALRTRIEQRRTKQNVYRKRKSTLIKKAYELGKLCEADVAVIICRNDRYFTYRSLNKQSWPPSMKDIVSMMSSIHLMYELNFLRRYLIHFQKICCLRILRKNLLSRWQDVQWRWRARPTTHQRWTSRARLIKSHFQKRCFFHRRFKFESAWCYNVSHKMMSNTPNNSYMLIAFKMWK